MPFCDKKKYKYLFKVAIYLIPALSGSPCTARISLWRRGKQSICEMKWMCNFGFRCDIDFLVSCWLFSFQFGYYCSQVLSVHCECKTLKPPPIRGARRQEFCTAKSETDFDDRRTKRQLSVYLGGAIMEWQPCDTHTFCVRVRVKCIEIRH